MEPVWGFILYLVLLIVITIIAGARRLAWWGFLLGTPVLGIGLAILGSLGSRGQATPTALMGFSSLVVAFLLAVALKSRAQKMEDGDAVAGFKKCPECAEQVRVEARKCRYCGADVSSV